MKRSVLSIFPVAVLLTVSCGKAPSTPAYLQPSAPVILPLDGSNIEGLYMAKFITLNPHINGTLPGSATIQRKDRKFYAFVRLFSGGMNVWHQQHIYTGNKCPTLSDDANGDGIIDQEEGSRAWGNVLIPLDSNLRSQLGGNNIYPVADAGGNYFYERVTDFEEMFNDLKSEDHRPQDNIAKIAPDEGLAIEGKVAVVFGVAAETELPTTVAPFDRFSPQQSLPVACGVFRRVTEVPGEDYDGEIPGPVADVEVDQDRPADGGLEIPGEPGDREAPHDSNEESDSWQDRVFEWWRDRWRSWRGDSRSIWGRG
jgi:hypothetical protein